MEQRFCLKEDEQYERVCGEIILTTIGRMVIHCTECEQKYENFAAYSSHIFDEHLGSFEDERAKMEINEAALTDLYETIDDDDTKSLKRKIECFDDEALKEEELPLSMLTEPKRRKVFGRRKISSQVPSDTQIIVPQEISMDEQFIVPDFVRNVQKRTNWVTEAVPTEQRKHKCPICGLAFKDKYNVRHHLIRHSGQKNFDCPKCDKKFYTSSEVKTHLRFHTKDRDFLCSDCGHSFKTKFLLQNHIKRHKNERDYKCKICDKAYFDSHSLKDHMYVHSKDKTLICKLCDSKFTRPVTLKNHMKLHENKRAYKCSICDVGFNQRAGLFSHMKITHKTT